ncbi:MAG: cytochrome c biogenesis protein CcdA [Candidatus Babeliaceae bacterium]
MSYKFLITNLFLLTSNTLFGAQLELSFQEESPLTQQVAITFVLEPGEILLKDFLKFTSLSQHLTLSDWKADHAFSSFYDESLNKNKEGWKNTVTLSFTATNDSENPVNHATIMLYYMTTRNPNLQDMLIDIDFLLPETPSNQTIHTLPTPSKIPVTQTTPASPTVPLISRVKNILNTALTFMTNFFDRIKIVISERVHNQESFSIQLCFVFLLGILMSLTPCIYPMIPITIGVLQSPNHSSVVRNFSLALAYTLGISTTFALLGVLAACGSLHFGQLLGSPFFVAFICIFLLYLAFSMFGFYELYIPRFLQPKSHNVKQGSYLSAFIFGVMSGSFTSPCLSPGLMLLLSVCATIGHKLYSFLLLFFFGLGLGLPLLIIGTFTSSLQLLPRAGMWMIEVKRLFGFLLIGLALYYASTFLSAGMTLLIITFGLMLIGIYYLILSFAHQTKAMHWFKYIIGTLCIIMSFISAAQAYKTYTMQEKNTDIWLHNYTEAQELALKQHKKMILDFGAAWCTLCKKIDQVIFNNPALLPTLSDFILVKIDCTQADEQQCKILTQKFSVKGYPTILIIDPQEETILYEVGSALLEKNIQDFIALLQNYR